MEKAKKKKSEPKPKSLEEMMERFLTSPHSIIRIRRRLVLEDYEKYGPIDPLYEQERKKNASSKKEFYFK